MCKFCGRFYVFFIFCGFIRDLNAFETKIEAKIIKAIENEYILKFNMDYIKGLNTLTDECHFYAITFF